MLVLFLKRHCEKLNSRTFLKSSSLNLKFNLKFDALKCLFVLFIDSTELNTKLNCIWTLQSVESEVKL